jgi:hypothetical protein
VVKDKDRVLVARQISICLWVLFVWGREIDNLDAPYRASELALLHVGELLNTFIGKKGAPAPYGSETPVGRRPASHFGVSWRQRLSVLTG